MTDDLAARRQARCAVLGHDWSESLPRICACGMTVQPRVDVRLTLVPKGDA